MSLTTRSHLGFSRRERESYSLADSEADEESLLRLLQYNNQSNENFAVNVMLG